MLGFYNYTVYLTYAGLLSALSGVFLAIKGKIHWAAICLLISGFCDMFDGKIARTKKDRTEDEKRFGIQIDSLCDVICFGILPAAMLITLPDVKIWQFIIAALFVLCGVIRLAYFNVTEETRQKNTSENRSSYSGLPITSSAVVIPLITSLSRSLGQSFSSVFAGFLAVLGLCYITPFKIKKPGRAGTVIFIILGIIILSAILITK